MKNIIYITTSVLLSSLLLSGCGSSAPTDSTDVSKSSKITPTQPKISRDFGDGSIELISEDENSFALKYSDEPLQNSHWQYYLDTDNNSKTGNAAMNGADYLIENGRLYRSTGTGWSWSYIKRVTVDLRDNSTVQATIEKSDLQNLSENINVISAFINPDNWNIVESAEESFVLGNNNADDGAGDNEFEITLNVNKQNINISASAANNRFNYSVTSTADPVKTNSLLLISSNQDREGKLYRYGVHSNYLIQNNNLYRYIGNGDNWSWQYVKRLNNSVTSDDLGGSSIISFKPVIFDSNWQEFDATDGRFFMPLNAKNNKEIIENSIKNDLSLESIMFGSLYENYLEMVTLSPENKKTMAVYYGATIRGPQIPAVAIYNTEDLTNIVLEKELYVSELLDSLQSYQDTYSHSIGPFDYEFKEISIIDDHLASISLTFDEDFTMFYVTYDYIENRIVEVREEKQ
jgi:hypothetical protein